MGEGETIFSRIVRGEIPCDKVYEDEHALAFRDIHPCAPCHVLVIPKEPIPSLAEADSGHEALLGHLMVVAAEVVRLEGLADQGFRIVVNNGQSAGQEVMHLHLHVLAGRPMGWPPG